MADAIDNAVLHPSVITPLWSRSVANPEFKPFRVTEEMDFTVFGRYDGLIRKTHQRSKKAFKIPLVE